MEAYLEIRRLRGPEWVLDGFTDTRFKKITVSINEDFPEPTFDEFAFLVAHEMKHLKYPKYSEKIVTAEATKQFSKAYGRAIPFEVETH